MIILFYLGKILSAKITGIETFVTKEDDLTLTCTFTKIQNCTRVYVYLCFNRIGKSKKQVDSNNTTISTTFILSNVSEKSVGNYSCMYSESNYSLSEVISTEENTIFVQVHGKFLSLLRYD